MTFASYGKIPTYIWHNQKLNLIIMNLGLNDRVLRLVSGLGLVTFDYFATANWQVVLLLFGTWGVLTSAFGFCPFYKIMGYNTCPTNFSTPSSN